MVLEATMICMDNSEWMRNSDYSPNRLLAQTEAVKRICEAKTQMDPENTVGVMAMEHRGVREWVTPTSDLGEILAFMNGLESGGEMNLAFGIRTAQYALQCCQNKKQQERIIVFVGSPIQHDKKTLELIGKNLKENSVALDIVNFGEEDEGKTEKLEALLAAVNNNDTSHIVHVPSGPNALSDVLISTPVFTGDGEGGSGFPAAAAAASGASAFEFGVDPNLGPDLALPPRVSMEEERARQEAAANKTAAEAATQGKEGEQPSSSQDATITDRVSGPATEAEPKKTDLTDEENALLQRALPMSMDDPAPSNNVQVTTMTEAATDDPGATGRILQSLKPPCTISAAQSDSVIPMLMEHLSLRERAYDNFSKLLKERIICINGPINDDTSHVVVAQLLFLESENPTEPIHMYLNSSGGNVTTGLAIYDTMQLIRPPIKTICLGQAASMASLLVAAGSKGERRSLPNAKIMIHQPSGWHNKQAKDLTIQSKQIVRVSDKLNVLYSKHTGQSVQVIEKSMDRDNFMTPEEAKEFGIIDEVIDQRHSYFRKLGF